MSICIYPGTFDPVTNGHLDLIRRAGLLFEHVIIGVAMDNHKQHLFSDEERLELVQDAIGDVPNVEVELFEGLLMDYCRQRKATAVLRGLRAVSDYEYELQMALMNKRLNPDVETVFLMSSQHYSFISSSLIKNVGSLGGDIKSMVPATVYRKLREKFGMEEA